MYNPCFTCWNRFGKQHTEECNNTCDYAATVKNLKAEIERLLKKIDDLEMEIECRNDW